MLCEVPHYLVNNLRAVAARSQLKIRIGALLIGRNNRIIGKGFNTNGISPTKAWTRHAEINATINRNARGCTIYVWREHKKTGEPLLSRPCESCMSWLKHAGIRQVIYSTSNGFVQERL